MTIDFALSLSFEGIDLLHRVQGGWQLIGSADLDDPDIGATLARMRDKANAIASGAMRCKIVIPPEQIKYLAIDSTQTDRADIHAALEGATPYALDELVIDHARAGGRTHIAAVARDTLIEAESFAREHGFNPVSFVAVPEPFTFQTEVFFGPTRMMPELLGPTGAVDRDQLPVLVVGTRIKSRLLVLDQDKFDESADQDLDLTTLLSRGAATAPQQDGDDAPLRQANEAAIADLFAAADQPAVPRQTVAPVRVDPIVAEYHPIRAVPKIRRPHAEIAATQIDRVIAEYHARPPAPPARTNTPLAAPTPVGRPVAALSRRRPLGAGLALAAGLLLAVGLIWSQDTAATSLPAAVTPTDSAPVVPLQDIAAQARPSTGALALATPGDFTPPAMQAPRRLAVIHAADSTLSDVPQPPATQTAPVVRGQVLSPDAAARIYATTGVWQRAPRFALTPRTASAGDMIRPAALPAPGRISKPETAALPVDETDLSFLAPADPPPADAVFPIDENGFIRATPDGTVTPEGAIVFAGLPDIQLRLRPKLSQDALARLTALRPAPDGIVFVPGPPKVAPPLRPDDLAATAISPGGVALSSLEPGAVTARDDPPASVRPRLRPAGAVPATPAAQAPDNPDITAVIAGLETDAAAVPFIDMTPRAVGVSTRPEMRPRNFDRVVASARSRQQARPQAADTATPSDEAPIALTLPQTTAPVPGGVARAATEDGVIALREMNLIGIYGRSKDRRALVRLSNGRYVRVEVGSALDGGQVTAIGDSALNYVKRGRTLTLALPTG